METIKTTTQVEQLLNIIDNSVQKLQFSSELDEEKSLFYLGNWHESIPLFIYRDPILESVDRNVYGVIRSLTSKESATAFPTYDDICQYANIASHATVSRAVAILRLVRWSTQRLVRCPLSGQIRRKVYIMHDQPLDLADTLQLDPDYMAFLNASLDHHHAYVRKVAKLVMKTIHQEMRAGKDMSEHEHHLSRQSESASYWIQSDCNYFGFSKQDIQALKKPENTATPAIPTSIIKEGLTSINEVSTLTPTLNTKDRPTSLNEVLTSKIEEHSSSSFLNNTTTHKTEENSKNIELTKKPKQSPKSSFQFTPYLKKLFSSNEKHLINMQLSRVDRQFHQPIINQISNRIEYGEKKVSRPISLLSWYCNELKAGRTPLTEYSLDDYQPENINPKPSPQHTQNQTKVEISNLHAELTHIENYIQSAKQSENEQQIQHWTGEKNKILERFQEIQAQRAA